MVTPTDDNDDNTPYMEGEKHYLLSKLDEAEVGHKFPSFCTLAKVSRENSE